MAAAVAAAGVSFVCDESRAAVSVLSFAKVRSDLLAFANQDGDIWLLYLPGQGQQEQEAAAAPFPWAAGAHEPVVKKVRMCDNDCLQVHLLLCAGPW